MFRHKMKFNFSSISFVLVGTSIATIGWLNNHIRKMKSNGIFVVWTDILTAKASVELIYLTKET